MTPFKLPSGFWLDVEHIQTIGPIFKQLMPRHNAEPVEVVLFNVQMAFQNNPLQFNHHNLLADGSGPLEAKDWDFLRARLAEDREALIRRWTNATQDQHEIGLDMNTVSNVVVSPELDDGSNIVEVTFAVDASEDGRALIDYLRNWNAQRKQAAGNESV